MGARGYYAWPLGSPIEQRGVLYVDLDRVEHTLGRVFTDTQIADDGRDNISGPLGWIVGIAAVVLIAVAVFAGINHAIHPTRDKPLATTGNAPNGGMKSPSTTGFGGSEEPLPPLPKRGG